MKIILNTSPLLFAQKTGIGYYVHNLYGRLAATPAVDVIPTVSTGGTRMFHALGRVSAGLRKIFGPGYNRVAQAIGDRVLGTIAGGGSSGDVPDVYHETYYDEPSGQYGCLVANLYDLSYLRYPELLPDDVVTRARAGLDTLRRADRIIVNSAFVRDEAVELLEIPAERIDVIPLAPSGAYGVPEKDRDPRRDRQAIRALVGNDPYVLYVGTVEPRKGLETLVDGFAQVVKAFPGLRLLIAGGLGWDYEPIVEKPGKEGIGDRVVFTGYIDEATMGALYRQARVFVYPSVYEGFGIPPLEAMSCRVPVIVSDIPPLRELVGQGGITFPAADHNILAERLESLLASEEEREIWAERGLRRSVEYSWDRVLGETLDTYRKASGDR